MGAPAPLRRASLLVGLQAVALAALGAGYTASGFLADPEDRVATVLAGLMALGAGLLLLPVARGLRTRRGWAWSATLVTQVFVVVVGVGLVQGRVWAVAVPMLAVAAGVLSQLAMPQSREAFRGLQ